MKKRYLLLASAAVLCWAIAGPALAETIRLEAENYKAGGEGVGFHDNDVGNNGGQYRTAPGDNVDIEGASEGGFNVGWTNGGEWFYMVTDTTPGPWTTDPTFAGGNYYVNFRVAADPGNGGGPIHVDVDGKTATSYGFHTGGWQQWASTSTYWHPGPTTPISAGSHPVQFRMDNGGFNINYVEFSTDAPAAVPARTLNFTPPQGGFGTWGVREVWNAGNVGNLEETVTRLNQDADGTVPGVRVDFQSPTVNFLDSGGGGNFGGDSDYGVVTAGHVAKGTVDNISLVYSGLVDFPATDTYTFAINTDDGFELSIDGKIVREANFGKGTTNIIGWADVPAGVHEVRLLSWDGGGGFATELSAAQGLKNSVADGGFALIGGPAVQTPLSPVRLVAPANVIVGPNVPGDPPKVPATIAAIRSAILDPAAPRGTANNVVLIGGGDSPCCGRPSESLPASLRVPFPNGNGQDNFTAGVFGSLLVDDGDATAGETLQLTFGLFSDDGTALRIYGQDFTAVGGDANAVLADIDGDMALVADFWTGNSNAYGLIELKEGTYGFESFVYEGGGGSALEIFVASGDKRGAYSHTTFSPLSINAGPIVLAPGGLQLVPEPTSLTLVGLGLLGLLGLRRRNG